MKKGVQWILCVGLFTFGQMLWATETESEDFFAQEDLKFQTDIGTVKPSAKKPEQNKATTKGEVAPSRDQTLQEKEPLEGMEEMEGGEGEEEEPLPEPLEQSATPAPDSSSIRVIPRSSSVTTPLYVPPKEVDIPIPRLLDLPESLQESIPPIKFMGHLYSTKSGKSSVIIENKLYYEGEEIAPELILEKVVERGAILNYQGTRFQVEIWGSQFYQ